MPSARDRLDPAERAALDRLAAIKKPLELASGEAARVIRTCTGCGICCEHPRNEMKATPLEALAAIVRVLDDPALRARLPELEAKIEGAIARFGLREVEDDGRAYTCPFLEEDRSCAIHGEGQPVGCVVFVPFTRDHCDFRWERLLEAGEQVGHLMDDLEGGAEWSIYALPIALRRALAALRRRGIAPPL